MEVSAKELIEVEESLLQITGECRGADNDDADESYACCCDGAHMTVALVAPRYPCSFHPVLQTMPSSGSIMGFGLFGGDDSPSTGSYVVDFWSSPLVWFSGRLFFFLVVCVSVSQKASR